ncbi:MAG: sulfite exporter TauE/SafE family protein [Cytophagales bacterium]|nr:sulfite exporter TauE/SafE family protein [Cytophagales bacterium]
MRANPYSHSLIHIALKGFDVDQAAFIFAGFVVGLIVGLTGVGGGSLMTPLLIFGFGIKPVLAVGTDLLFAAFTKLGGLVGLVIERRVEWRVVGALSLGSIPASLLTLYLIHQHGQDVSFQQVITKTLGYTLIVTAIATLYKAIKGKARQAMTADAADIYKPLHPLLPVAFGAIVGVLITITSVGAGAIGVMALMFLYPRLPLSRIVAADIAYAIPITLIAGLGHASLGTVDGALLVKLLLGSLPGIWLGTRLGPRMPEGMIRGLLAFLIAYAGIKLITR